MNRQKNTFGMLLLSAVCLVGAGNTAAAEPVAETESPQIETSRTLLPLAEETSADYSPFLIPETEQAIEQSISQHNIDDLTVEWQSFAQQDSVQQISAQQDSERLALEERLALAERSITQSREERDYQTTENQVIELESESSVYDESPALLTQVNGDKAPPKFGQAGKQRWYVQGGLGADFDDDLFGLVGAGVSHFFYNGHSINLELNGLAVDQQGNNAVGLNLALLVRSHWIRGENWSIYVDGGAGLLTTNNDVPDAGSSFNFTPQIGGGATFAVNDTQRIMTGLRWYHISNAGTFDANPGLDALYGYVGYNFPF
ncbi:acyloxyacyl hydrolase [cf. Phormidesmis sp. LEGE 11477]|nr:acyloxyacyl hydrolase [cf. Phormidesmis sp. LEGE 11477]